MHSLGLRAPARGAQGPKGGAEPEPGGQSGAAMDIRKFFAKPKPKAAAPAKAVAAAAAATPSPAAAAAAAVQGSAGSGSGKRKREAATPHAAAPVAASKYFKGGDGADKTPSVARSAGACFAWSWDNAMEHASSPKFQPYSKQDSEKLERGYAALDSAGGPSSPQSQQPCTLNAMGQPRVTLSPR